MNKEITIKTITIKMKYETFKRQEKELQALEIIKNKNIVWDIDYQPYEEDDDYRAWDNELYQGIKLTKEEYDLLKEVLK